MFNVREKVCLMFPTEYADAERHIKAKGKRNVGGTLLNRLLTILEDNALQYIFKFFTEEGYMPEVLCFDGLMIPRKHFDCDEEFDALCKQCTQYVQVHTQH